MKITVHFNKFTAKHGKPWTVHTYKGCVQVNDIVSDHPPKFVFKPDKPTNPRAWLEFHGTYEVKDDICYLTST